MGFLDSSGLAYLWGKIKDYVDNRLGGGTVQWEDINGRPDLSTVSSMKVAQIVLLSELWDDDNQQAVSVPGVLENENQQIIVPVPKENSKAAYYNADIKCVEQGADEIVFHCQKVPEEDLRVNIFIFGAAEIGEEYVGEFVWWSPQMTSNNTPAPYVASASSQNPDATQPYGAFDGIPATGTTNDANNGGKWVSALQVSQAFIQIDFGMEIIFKSVKINPGYTVQGLATPKNLYLDASNDGVNWNRISNWENINWANIGEYSTFKLTKPIKYRFCKLGSSVVVNANEPNPYRTVSFGDIQFLKLEAAT